MQVTVCGGVWLVSDGATVCSAGWVGIHGNAKNAKPALISVYASDFYASRMV
jgi:hypothetical protein